MLPKPWINLVAKYSTAASAGIPPESFLQCNVAVLTRSLQEISGVLSRVNQTLPDIMQMKSTAIYINSQKTQAIFCCFFRFPVFEKFASKTHDFLNQSYNVLDKH